MSHARSDSDTKSNSPSDQDTSNHNFYKCEMCRSWTDTGTCRYGPRCQFAHGIEELRPRQRGRNYKTKPCRSWEETGSCPYGKRCQFLHGDGDEDENEVLIRTGSQPSSTQPAAPAASTSPSAAAAAATPTAAASGSNNSTRRANAPAGASANGTSRRTTSASDSEPAAKPARPAAPMMPYAAVLAGSTNTAAAAASAAPTPAATVTPAVAPAASTAEPVAAPKEAEPKVASPAVAATTPAVIETASVDALVPQLPNSLFPAFGDLSAALPALATSTLFSDASSSFNANNMRSNSFGTSWPPSPMNPSAFTGLSGAGSPLMSSQMPYAYPTAQPDFSGYHQQPYYFATPSDAVYNQQMSQFLSGVLSGSFGGALPMDNSLNASMNGMHDTAFRNNNNNNSNVDASGQSRSRLPVFQQLNTNNTPQH